ncbi:hypothetical protein DPMN_065177 [Dreissena polymorpha]|uniref:Uncharacterized protein n=1 Tax=Dreissena polymorpha TaxID=45954 RepID=A0A9D4CEQ8_DREPO|nr:hypothetical protein DPMN_065177 [Dreissena polymorpha]
MIVSIIVSVAIASNNECNGKEPRVYGTKGNMQRCTCHDDPNGENGERWTCSFHFVQM